MELIVALAVFGILAAGVITVAVNSYRNYYGIGDKQVLAQFAQEGLEVSRDIANFSWVTFKNAVGSNHGVTKSNGLWTFSGTSDVLGVFTRVIIVANVNRDSNGNIVTSGGSNDPLTKKVTVTVSASGMSDYVLSEYISDYGTRVWQQTDWSSTRPQTYWHDYGRTSSLSNAASSTVTNFNTTTAGELTVAGASAANLISSIYTIGSAAKELRALTVQQSQIASGCSLQVTLQVDSSNAFSSPVSQVFSDTSALTYTSSTNDTLNGKLYMRYQVDMSGCATASTTLYDIKIKYR